MQIGGQRTMWTLLFLVAAIIFLVLWNDAKQRIKQVEKTQYDRGYSAGYWALADRLAQSSSDFDIEKFKQKIGADSYVASPQATEQAEYFVESDVDVPELRPEVPKEVGRIGFHKDIAYLNGRMKAIKLYEYFAENNDAESFSNFQKTKTDPTNHRQNSFAADHGYPVRVTVTLAA